MRLVAWCVTAGALFAGHAAAADFGTPGGPPPANIEEITGILRQDLYDIELLISYGTSKGGSAGHLALAIRDQAPGDDMVYSANFYADRNPAHREGLLHRRSHGPDPEEGVPLRDDLVARPQGLVRPRLRRDLQAIGDRRARLRRAGRGEGGARGLLQPPQRRLSQPRREDRVPRRGDQVRLPAPELRQDHRRGVQARRRVQGPGGHEREDSLRAEGGSGGQRQRPHRDGDEAHQGVGRARLRTGRRAVQEVRRLDLRGPAREGEGGVQGPAQPVPLRPVARLPERAGAIRGLRQSLRDVPPLQRRQVQRARERRDEAARDRKEQTPHGLPGGRRARCPKRQVRQRELPPAHPVPDEGNQHRGRGKQQRYKDTDEGSRSTSP